MPVSTPKLLGTILVIYEMEGLEGVEKYAEVNHIPVAVCRKLLNDYLASQIEALWNGFNADFGNRLSVGLPPAIFRFPAPVIITPPVPDTDILGEGLGVISVLIGCFPQLPGTIPSVSGLEEQRLDVRPHLIHELTADTMNDAVADGGEDCEQGCPA